MPLEQRRFSLSIESASEQRGEKDDDPHDTAGMKGQFSERQHTVSKSRHQKDNAERFVDLSQEADQRLAAGAFYSKGVPI